jgi:hypothetical protein
MQVKDAFMALGVPLADEAAGEVEQRYAQQLQLQTQSHGSDDRAFDDVSRGSEKGMQIKTLMSMLFPAKIRIF